MSNVKYTTIFPLRGGVNPGIKKWLSAKEGVCASSAKTSPK